jgi:hypothetical protein
LLVGAGVVVGRVAAAQPAAPVVRWEMTCLTSIAVTELVAEGQKLGRDGWELTTSTGTPGKGHLTLCFKRPLR